MSDITKCHGRNCPLRDTCYRYTAPANEYRQAYWTGVDLNKRSCDMYIKAYPVDDAEPPPPDSGFVKL